MAERGMRPDAVTLTMGRYADADALPAQRVVVDGSEGTSVQMAPCCRPIPGDAIVGYLGRGEGLRRAHRRVQGRQAAVRARQRALDERRVGRGADAPVRDRDQRCCCATARACWRRWRRRSAPPRPTSSHIDMGDEPAAESAELRLVLGVRDRLHLAEVMRMLKRSAAVLRVARVKP